MSSGYYPSIIVTLIPKPSGNDAIRFIDLLQDPGVLLEFSTNKERRIELHGFSGVKDEDIQDSIKLKWIINWLCLRSLIFMSS